jgi:hypothetical protein
MPVFDQRFYRIIGQHSVDIEGYRVVLLKALDSCSTPASRQQLLHEELIEITRHITEGVRDLIKHDRRIGRLVRDLGVVPLATWTDALSMRAEHSITSLKHKIAELQRELEQGRVEGFPATLLLAGKPTFTTFEPFYSLIFNLADNNSAGPSANGRM